MNKEDLNQLATVNDLEAFYQRIVKDVKGLLYDKQTLGKVNSSALAKGVYFVKVFNNTDSFTVKLIKE
jgi:outer membrane translocation and assembly module TamA